MGAAAELPGSAAELPGFAAELPGHPCQHMFETTCWDVFWSFWPMEPASRSFSNSTLVRGCQLVRNATMSLESDPDYAEMVKQKKELEATRSIYRTFSSVHFIHGLFLLCFALYWVILF